jgi:two-component system LytT family response regulator
MSIFRKNIALEMQRAIIIDDEAHTRHTIRKMLADNCPALTIVAEANSVSSGVEAIKNHKPDLIFLDIKMDDGTGFDLLEKLKPIDFKIVFITAYNQYAIKAFKFSALDYLLKPVDVDDLAQAVKKAGESQQKDFNTQLNNLNEHIHSQDKNLKKIIVRNANSISLIAVKDIVYCESDSNYTNIYLSQQQKIMVSATLKEYEELLIDYGFFRVHKSYLINLRYITRFEKAEGGTVILVNDIRIPVASRKKDMLLEMFNRLAEI